MTRPTEHVHETGSPDDDDTAAAVAAVLATGAAIASLAAGITRLLPGVTRPAVVGALSLVLRGTAHRPRARLAANRLTPRSPEAGAVRAAADAELSYRAAYVVNAARRLQEALDAGKSLPEALAAEAPRQAAHELARRRRVDAAAKVARAARQFGDLVGWYRDPESHSEADCIAADGNNFLASEGTVIGLPGTVHLHCRCEPGPPHPFAGMVNDALSGVVVLRPRSVFRPRRAATG
jgi:hypothetical protein